MRTTKHLFLSVLCFAFLGIKGHAQTTSTSTPIKQLNAFIAKKLEFNRKKENGYCIILHLGDEKEAKEKYYQFKAEFNDIAIELTYDSPNWIVLTKTHPSKIYTERLLTDIKQKFPNAKLVEI